MMLSQHHYSAHWTADALALGMVALFLTTGPWAYRLLFPPITPRSAPVLRLGAFILLGALPGVMAVGIPAAFELPGSFLTSGINVAVATTLFLAGSWGLARDIELESGLTRERKRADALAREAERAIF
jgi:hypothetical protein